MPMSTGMTSHFATRAIRFAEEQPFARSAATRAVMDSSVCVTPWAITPLSAHSTTSARRLMLKRPLPTAAAMRVTRSSRSPRLFRGLATWLQRFSDSFSAFLSGPGMRELIFCRSSDTISSFSLSVSVRAARRPGAGKFRACAAAGFAGGLKSRMETHRRRNMSVRGNCFSVFPRCFINQYQTRRAGERVMPRRTSPSGGAASAGCRKTAPEAPDRTEVIRGRQSGRS